MLNASIPSNPFTLGDFSAASGLTGDAASVPGDRQRFEPVFSASEDLTRIPGFPGTDTPDFQSDSPQSHAPCRRAEVYLSAYLDRELDTETTQALENHLVSCPNCMALKNELIETDESLRREWQQSLPLPSLSLSSRETAAISRILASLPPDPVSSFAPRRIHARARWMRFSAGVVGFIALLCLLWSGYRAGYAQVRSEGRVGTGG